MRLVAAHTHEAPESDAALLSEIAEGRLSSLGKLYDRHRASVLAFATRTMGNVADAEDVTHTTFMTAAKIAGRFDPTALSDRTSCRPWLLGIAARTISQHRRGWSRLTRFLGRLVGEATEASHDPEPLLAARGALAEVGEALATLSAQKRVVLVMFEVEGLSCDEIAQALEIPIGTVWTRLHAARRELRAKLPKEEG